MWSLHEVEDPPNKDRNGHPSDPLGSALVDRHREHLLPTFDTRSRSTLVSRRHGGTTPGTGPCLSDPGGRAGSESGEENRQNCLRVHVDVSSVRRCHDPPLSSGTGTDKSYRDVFPGLLINFGTTGPTL